MFMQVIQGHVRDADAMRRASDQWRRELQPGAPGFLGSTSGVTPDGMGVVVARFADEQSARANSERPEQSAWWERTSSVFDGEVSFIDCPDCDVIMDGGSDDARFVQLIECRATDRDAMREAGRSMEAELHTSRPDVLGGIIGWHDGREFVQVMYFSDEEHARAGERAMEENAQNADWTKMLEGEPRFLDLRNPLFA